MNKDFHYYATYLAAMLAEYSSEEAQTIAHAATFVDYYDSSTAAQFKAKIGNATYTTQNGGQLTFYYGYRSGVVDLYYEEIQNEVARIWTSFHFLPSGMGYDHNGMAVADNKCHWDSWMIDAKAEELYKLICRTNSNFAVRMINDILTSGDVPSLHTIGLRMHVLADTWAHQYFSGVGEWFLNDTKPDVYECKNPEDMPGKKLIWNICSSIDIGEDNEEKVRNNNEFFCTPPADFYSQITYLGHGRMGHVPDYAFMRYRYQPWWSSKEIFRDGVAEFKSALAQMAFALTCIKKRVNFTPGVYFDLDAKMKGRENKFKEQLEIKKLDQSEQWKFIITNLFEFPEPTSVFRETLWFEEYKDNNVRNLTEFDKAAKRQMNFVEKLMEEYEMYPYTTPANKKLDIYLKTKTSKYVYISKAYHGWDTYKYPTVGEEKVKLTMIKAGNMPLRYGDVVELRTDEAGNGIDAEPGRESDTLSPYIDDGPFMGTYLSKGKDSLNPTYQTRTFGSNNHKWRIEPASGGSADEEREVKSGDNIVLVNVHFEKYDTDNVVPYLNVANDSYHCLLLSKEKRKWIIEFAN